jgi:hypothetical protein
MGRCYLTLTNTTQIRVSSGEPKVGHRAEPTREFTENAEARVASVFSLRTDKSPEYAKNSAELTSELKAVERQIPGCRERASAGQLTPKVRGQLV